MTINLSEAKRRLAMLWFSGAGITFFVVLLQTVFGKFDDKSGEAWGWLLPTILPTSSLMIAVFVEEANSQSGAEPRNVDRLFFWLTFFICGVYLVGVALPVFAGPLTNATPLNLMKASNLWLGPLQGLVVAALGAFFLRSKGAKKSDEL